MQSPCKKFKIFSNLYLFKQKLPKLRITPSPGIPGISGRSGRSKGLVRRSGMVWFGLEGSESPTAIFINVHNIHSFILDTVVPFPTDIAGVAVNVIRRRTNWEKYISCQTHRSS